MISVSSQRGRRRRKKMEEEEEEKTRVRQSEALIITWLYQLLLLVTSSAVTDVIGECFFSLAPLLLPPSVSQSVSQLVRHPSASFSSLAHKVPSSSSLLHLSPSCLYTDRGGGELATRSKKRQRERASERERGEGGAMMRTR